MELILEILSDNGNEDWRLRSAALGNLQLLLDYGANNMPSFLPLLIRMKSGLSAQVSFKKKQTQTQLTNKQTQTQQHNTLSFIDFRSTFCIIKRSLCRFGCNCCFNCRRFRTFCGIFRSSSFQNGDQHCWCDG